MDDSLDSKARNRANQRRSRQRQKDHIQSLEARLAEYEKHGAQASKAIQMAARRVADENRKLRELLGGLGFAAGDMDAYLAGAVSVQELAVARASSDASDANNQSQSQAMGAEAQSTSRQSTRTRSCERAPTHAEMMVDHAPMVVETPPGRENGVEEQCAQDSNTQEPVKEAQAEEVQILSPVQAMEVVREASLQPQPDETDCEDAARIIAGMRGIGHPDDVRSELGCMPGGKCHIKNSRIFDLIDQ